MLISSVEQHPLYSLLWPVTITNDHNSFSIHAHPVFSKLSLFNLPSPTCVLRTADALLREHAVAYVYVLNVWRQSKRYGRMLKIIILCHFMILLVVWLCNLFHCNQLHLFSWPRWIALKLCYICAFLREPVLLMVPYEAQLSSSQ